MAAPSCYPDLNYVEADLIQQQSELLRGFARDIQYAVDLFNYTAYDIDNRSMAVRRAGWINTSGTVRDGEVPAIEQTVEQEVLAKMLVEDTKLILDIAGQVKSSLKALVEIVRKTPAITDTNSEDTGLSRASSVVDHGAALIASVALTTPLEDQLALELTKNKRVYVDTSKFVPGKFKAIWTPINKPSEIEVVKHEESKQSCKARIINDETMSRCQGASKALQGITESRPRRAKGRPPGSKNKPLIPYIEIPAPALLKVDVEVNEGSLSPRSRSEELDKQLLAWIPGKIVPPTLRVDEILRDLMLKEAKNNPDRWY